MHSSLASASSPDPTCAGARAPASAPAAKLLSWCCAITGLPILAANVAERLPWRLPGSASPARATVLYPSGARFSGRYDGMGGLYNEAGTRVEVRMDLAGDHARMVLTDLCLPRLVHGAGEAGARRLYASLAPNRGDPYRGGHDLDADFAAAMFAAKLAAAAPGREDEDIDGWQYPQRVQEWQQLAGQLAQLAGEFAGCPSPAALRELVALHAAALAGQGERLPEQVAALQLGGQLRHLSPFLAAAAVHAIVQEAARRARHEVLRAWQQGRAAQMLSARDLLTGAPLAPGEGASAPLARAERQRAA